MSATTPRDGPWRRRLRASLRVAAVLLLGAILGATAVVVAVAPAKPRLEPWHRMRPGGEITAAAPARDFADYIRREDALFAEVAADLHRQAPRLPRLSRFDPSSPASPLALDRDWNRSFELAPRGATRGAALLLHGLSDAPYSLRAIGAALAAHGFAVVAPRLPGHGTVPGALAAATVEDWRAAVRVSAAEASARAGDGPLLLVGYSNGAALALDYTLAAQRDTSLRSPERPPDGLVFLSPAFAVTGAARFAGVVARAARVPGLERLAWQSIQPEIEPYKYASFPVAAGHQIHRLTTDVERGLARVDASHALPPVLTLQSVVDATVPPIPSLTRLYSRVLDARSELVVFDANRHAAVAPLLSARVDELLSVGAGRTYPFAVTLVTNASATSDAVIARRWPAGQIVAATQEPLDAAWPRGVYSLSHVALPFPPDDPVYGVDAPQRGPFPLGQLEVRGERGAFLVPAEQLTRLRYDPFFAYVERCVVRFAEARHALLPGAKTRRVGAPPAIPPTRATSPPR